VEREKITGKRQKRGMCKIKKGDEQNGGIERMEGEEERE
jgi:hypothetical protein